MTRSTVVKISVLLLFAVLYSVCISLGLTCALNLFGICFALSLDGGVIEQYPRFIPFCLVVGLLSLTFLVLLLIVNIKYSQRLEYTEGAWCIQTVCVCIISFFAIKAWETLFELMQRVF